MPIFRPLLAGAHFSDRVIACIGAAAGIALTLIVCRALPITAGDVPLIAGPIGASAVLAFAVPASPLAQPWPIVGGTTLSALVGVTVQRHVGDPALAAALAVSLAILVMSLLRCLHPPGGAAALTAVIGSPDIHAAGYGFAFVPIAINAIVLVALAIAFHRISGHSYPHRPLLPPAAIATERQAAGFHAQDIDRALEDLHEGFDISRADLDLLISRAEHHAALRFEAGTAAQADC